MQTSLTEQERAGLAEQMRLVLDIKDARARHDGEGAGRLRRAVAPPAPVLMAAKRALGAEWVRAMGYDTKAADEAYGEWWLDRPDRELWRMAVRLASG